MKKLALCVATFLLAFAPAVAHADSDHSHGGSGASAQRIDWD